MDDKAYKIYDATVSFLMQDMLERTQGCDEISFINFCPNSREHLVVAWCAMYAASLADKKVALNLSLIDYIKFRIKNRRMKAWYKMKGGKPNIDIPYEIGQIYQNVNGAEIFKTGIGDIYDEYYAPRKEN